MENQLDMRWAVSSLAFILLNDGVIGNLVAAVQLAKQIAQLSGF